MTIIKETRDLIGLFIDPHTNHLTDVTPVTDIDHAHTLEIIILHATYPLLDHLLDQEILGFLDLTHTHIPKIILIHSSHKLILIQFFFEVDMYHPIEMANAVTPTSWFYSSTHIPH